MRPMLLAFAVALSAFSAQAQTVIGSYSTNMRFFGPNDKIVVERYDDPAVANVSCYVSRAITGGLERVVGLASDPSRFSVACRATGPVTVPAGLPHQATVFSASESPLFKTLNIVRINDSQKRVLIYLVTSTHLASGSPFNSISAVVYK